jgi:hypothetical protein
MPQDGHCREGPTIINDKAVRMPTRVAFSWSSSWTSRTTGGTANMVSCTLRPTSQRERGQSDNKILIFSGERV